MKRFLAFVLTFVVVFSGAAFPAAFADDVLTEEKIDLTEMKTYRFAYNQSSGLFECSGEATNADYRALIDGDYSTDAAIGQQIFVMIDLGREYPISTIKAYQNAENGSNFVSVLENCQGEESTFTRNEMSDLLRTNITSTVENGANCYTLSNLDSPQHSIGNYRYIFLYNWSTRLTLSEIELYADTTIKHDSLSVRNFYGDNMVLQRGKEHVIKGYSATGEKVDVTMTEDAEPSNTQTVSADVESDGSWTARLAPMTAGTSPYTITIADGTSAAPVVLENVLVGDVFLAAGQSNMNYEAPNSADSKDNLGDTSSGYYKKGMYEKQLQCASDMIRIFKMYQSGSGTETFDVPIAMDWRSSSDATNGVINILSLSSLGAFFAKNVVEEGIPVGIIQATWSGTDIGYWIKGGYCYNNHIAPFESFNIAGILWYQGCNDAQAGRFEQYYSKFKSVVEDYRRIFGNDDDLPFIYAQLAPYKNSRPEYEYGLYQRFQIIREIQRRMLDDEDVNKNLGMVVSLDTIYDTPADMIHPLGKDILGKRFAEVYKAMRNDTGAVVSGPLFESAAVEGNAVRISFKENTAEGLQILNPDYSYEQDGSGRADSTVLDEFEIAGADGEYYPAEAEIDGDTVIVSSAKVSAPKYVRYAYSERPENPNLANGAGLPASSFNIGIDGESAPTASPETEPTPAPTASAAPTASPDPDAPEFTTKPSELLNRGVEEPIGGAAIPVDASMQFRDGDNIAVIGDGITAMDYYVEYLTEIYAAKKPDEKIKFYNMGIEGAEASSAGEMLDREFELIKEYDNVTPNKAMIMLGMNDANKSSDETDETNIETYAANMSAFIDEVRAKGVEDITIMSSSPYDDNLQSDAADDIADGYIGARERLLGYARELERIAGEKDCRFIDFTKIMYELLDEYQKDDNSITFINDTDRTHPSEFGGYVMAYIIAKTHGLDGVNEIARIALKGGGASSDSESIANAAVDGEELSFTYTLSGQSIGVTTSYAKADAVVPLTKDFNQEIIKVSGLSEGYYEIDVDGAKSGPYTASELERGVNLALIENTAVTRGASLLRGDAAEGSRVVDRIRNIRNAERKAMEAGVDITDDAAVLEYISDLKNDMPDQYRNAYLDYKPMEKELFEEYAYYVEKLYSDVGDGAPTEIVIRPNTVGSESTVWYDNFSDGDGKWKAMQLNGDAVSEEEYGSAAYDPLTGADLTNGSGAGSLKIEIGLNKCRNYYTLKDRVNVIGGHTYQISAQVKTENARPTDLVYLSVIFFAKDGTTQIGQDILISDDVKGTHDWIELSETLSAPEKAAYMRIDVSGRGMTDGAAEKLGSVWYDDVRVTSKLSNPDFEESENGVVLNWTTTDISSDSAPENYSEDMMTFKDTSGWKVNNKGSAVRASYDKENYITGDKSLKFVSTAEGDSTDQYYICPGTEDYIKLEPNANYKITMKAKTENYRLLTEFTQSNAAGATYQALLFGESNGAPDTSQRYSLSESYLNVPGSVETASSSDWTDYSTILKTPEAKQGQDCVYLRSNIMMRFASGTVWIDSVTVQKCDETGAVVSNENADATNKVSGEQSLVVNGGTNPNGVTYRSEPISVIGSAEYMLRAYAYTDETAVGRIGVETYNSKSQKVDETFIEIPAATGFTEYVKTLTIPSDAVYATATLYAKDGRMNVDDILLSMTELDKNIAFEPVRKYNISFVNYDDEPLQTLKTAEGEVPRYTGEIPTRPKDENYDYVFSGWSPELTAATEDAVYKAEYEAVERIYIETLGEYADMLTVEEITDGGETALSITPKPGASLPKLTLYSAVYTENNMLKNVDIVEYSPDENGNMIIVLPALELNDGEKHKIMLWDSNQVPVINVR